VSTLAKLVHTSAFRLVALFLLVFALSAMLVIGYIYYNTNVLLARQVTDTINAEAQVLAEQYQSGGIARLIAAVEQRSAAPGYSVYLVSDGRGRPLAGNLYGAPEGIDLNVGWHEFVFERFDSGVASQRLALARSFQLANGFHLMVGRDIEERRRFEGVITSALLWGLGLMLVLGIGGGLLASRRMLARLDAMAATSQRIMAGDLTNRIPETGSGDELDRLAKSLNEMLDRIEALMHGLKEVSDNIAHDLKTPLTRLRTRAETVLREESSPQAIREALERTIEESDQLIRTFNALLSIARAEAGTAPTAFAALDAAAIVRDVAELFEPTAEEKGAVIHVEAETPAPFLGDRDLVSQAIANLVENALNYGLPEKANGGEAGDLWLKAEKRDGQVSIAVLDRGPGIPEADRGRVLERFVRLETSRSRPGSGLGLSLVAAVARLHKGTLELDDNAPGLAVTMRLPGGEGG
jgi:signal transduction histidine kinase